MTARAAVLVGVPPAAADYRTAEAGNPFADGWYADLDTAVCILGLPNDVEELRRADYLAAFSSTDLVHWTKHSRVLDTARSRGRTTR